MKRFLSLFIIMVMSLILSACSLVVEDKTPSEQEEIKIKEPDVIGFQIEEEMSNKTVRTEYFNINNLMGKDVKTSYFFSNTHVKHGTKNLNGALSEKEYTVETTFNADINSNPDTCYTLSVIMKYEDGTTQPTNHHMVCHVGLKVGMSLEKIEDDVKYKTNISVTFKDIDYLKEYVVIQYGADNNKLKETVIDLSLVTSEPFEISIQKDAVDFKIIETYIDSNDQEYTIRKLFTPKEITSTRPFYDDVYALNASNENVRYNFKFTINENSI